MSKRVIGEVVDAAVEQSLSSNLELTKRDWQKPQLEVKPVGETAGPPGGSTNNGPFASS